MPEAIHAARRRRERGAAAVLTIRPQRLAPSAERRRAMAAHPAGKARHGTHAPVTPTLQRT